MSASGARRPNAQAVPANKTVQPRMKPPPKVISAMSATSAAMITTTAAVSIAPSAASSLSGARGRQPLRIGEDHRRQRQQHEADDQLGDGDPPAPPRLHASPPARRGHAVRAT